MKLWKNNIFSLIKDTLSRLFTGYWKLHREIRSRKEAEAALLKSEQKFRVVFESANVGKSITRPTGEIEVNQALCDMLGYTREELTNKRWQDLTHPDEIEANQNLLDPLLKGETDSVRFYKRYIHKNGSYIWADVSTAIHRDIHSKPLFFITTVIDITERKRAEEMLLENNALFAKISSQVPGMLYRFARKPDGTYFVPFSNNGIKDIFGCSPEDVRDTLGPILKAIFPEDRDRIIQTIEESAKNLSPWECEYRVQLPGKPVRWIHGNSIPDKTADGTTIWSGYNTDITERKQTEKALHESEDLFRNLFHRHTAIKLLIDPENGQIIDANEAAANFYGWTCEQLMNMKIQNINILPPEDVKEAMKKAERMERIHFEFQHRRADGSIRDVEVFSGKFEIKGKVLLHSIINDITDKKRAEESIIKLNEELEQKVDERTAELKKTILQLEELNRVFVDRELRMAELKEQMAELEKQKT